MTHRSNVRPTSQRLTDADARHLLSAGLIRACHHNGPSRVAFEVGCDEKTIRRARDEESTLGLAAAVNLLDVDDTAIDELMAAKGWRLVPVNARCDTDAMISTSAAVHSIAEARSPFSPGGATETDAELLAMESTLDSAIESLSAMKAKIIKIKLRRAAA